MVQWLRLGASTAGNMGSIPGRGTKGFLVWRGPKEKKKKLELNVGFAYIIVVFTVLHKILLVYK